MNITVRVVAAQALAQSRAVQKELRGINAAAMGGAGGVGGLNAAMGGAGLMKFGKNLQWTGRQLQYNFTLPIVLAGVAATKWANDNEAAMTRVRKVYGDGTESAGQLDAELNALRRSFELLSSRFGIHQDEVIDIAGSWAQAGSAGVALANATRLTMEAMILGEVDAEKATTGLIAIQAIFGLQTVDLTGKTYDLRQALADMNAIENTTSIKMSDLIDVLSRAGGVAVTAGIGIRELSAMAASLVPAAGSGAQAGNGLRTMISRILAPTKEAVQVLHEMGIEVNSTTWQMKNGHERVLALAEAFAELDDNQKAQVSSIVSSRWQINRFDILMRDVLDPVGNYARALNATATPAKALATYTRELTTYLRSTPQAFKILTTQLQNALAKAILPMLPAFIAILTRITQMVDAFTNLDPAIQQLILGFLAFIAIVGPIAKLVGSIIELFALLGPAIMFVLRPILAVIAGFLSFKALVIGAVIAAVAALIYIFRDELAPVVDFVLAQFYKLPQGIQDVFILIVKTVSRAVLAVYEWLSYLNPFARHSPSLVDQVKLGVDTILNDYARLNGIGGILRNALAAIEQFKAATGTVGRNLDAKNYAAQRKEIVAVAPNAGPAVDAIIGSIMEMQGALDLVNVELQQQQTLVDGLRDQIDTVMKPYNEAIWQNEMAQKRLRLELLKMEQAGQSIDGVRDKLSDLKYDIDALRSGRQELELGGAGADILRVYDSEIDSLEKQRAAIEASGAAAENTKEQLDRLNLEGQILELEKDVKFDPQLHELELQEDKLRDLESVYNDISGAISDMEGALSGFISKANTVKDQENLLPEGADFPDVDQGFGLGREGGLPEIDEFNKQLEDELAKAMEDLGKIDLFKPIKDGWNKLWANIKEEVSPILEPIVGAIQEKLSGISFDAGDIGSGITDFFEGIGKKIKKSGFRDAWEDMEDIFGNMDQLFEPIGNVIGIVIDKVVELGAAIGDELKNWGELGEPLVRAFQNIAKILTPALKLIVAIVILAFKAIAPYVKFVFDVIIARIRGALEIIRGIIKLVLAIINGDWGDAWDAILTIVDGIWDILYGTVKAGIELVAAPFMWLYDVLLKDILEKFVAVLILSFKGMLTTIKKIWDAIGTAIQWVWKNVILPVWNAIKSVWEGTLKPVLDTMLSVFKTVWDGIGRAIDYVWNNVIKKVFDAIKTAIDTLGMAFMWLRDQVITPVWNGIQSIISGAWNGIKSVMETGINALITVFNFLASGVNVIARALGLGIEIPEIGKVNLGGGGSAADPMSANPGVGWGPGMAKGGMIPPAPEGGFFGTQARAIVNEGSKIHREFVIPTDPRYRSRAMDLFKMLGMDLGVPMMAKGGVVPGMAAGGIPGPIDDVLGGFIGGAIGLAKDAAGAVKAFWDIISKVVSTISDMGLGFLKKGANFLKDMVVDWAKEQISKIPGVGLLGDVVGGVTDVGGAIVGGAADVGGAVLSAPGKLAGLLGAQGLVLGPNIPGLANGGIVMPSPGGTVVRLAERGVPEMVKPLSAGIGGGGESYNFYGDMSFPNITSGDDSAKFISNLKLLAG